MRGLVALFVCQLLYALPSAAEVVLRPAVGSVVAFESGGAKPLGQVGFSGGYNLELEPIVLIPELSLAAMVGDGIFLSRTMAGVRAGFAGPVEPALLFRVGYGNRLPSWKSNADWQHGFALQTGLGLDYRFARSFTVGGELYYDMLALPQPLGSSVSHSLGLALTLSWSL